MGNMDLDDSLSTDDVGIYGSEGMDNMDNKEEEKPNKEEMEDLKVIGKDMQKLKSILSRIEMRQTMERMRVAVQGSLAEDNHQSMVRSSMLETLVLILVTFGQIYLIRRWFQGKGTLLKSWV
ncbi:unnamed protein product [Discosporangium mesarthrocarpum]